ncbi:MAG TPA: lipid A biosynthesis acyltransferase [Parasegetibacter sp.]
MYYILYGFFYLLSLLPFWVIYRISDFLYLILYYVVGYRRKVVMANLDIAFPEKSKEEKTKIAKEFYLSFIDNWLEAIKLLSISQKELARRCELDLGKFPEIYANGKTCYFIAGHTFNWEFLVPAIALNKTYQLLAVYKPVENKAVDRLFKTTRTRTGVKLLASDDMRRAMAPFRNQQYVMVLVADQNPPDLRNSYWIEFFGKPVPFATGTERISKRINAPVFFLGIYKKKRGYYGCRVEVIDEAPATSPQGAITVSYVEKLEQFMKEHPSNWLWSHRRWKHKFTDEYKDLLVTR